MVSNPRLREMHFINVVDDEDINLVHAEPLCKTRSFKYRITHFEDKNTHFEDKITHFEDKNADLKHL